MNGLPWLKPGSNIGNCWYEWLQVEPLSPAEGGTVTALAAQGLFAGTAPIANGRQANGFTPNSDLVKCSIWKERGLINFGHLR